MRLRLLFAILSSAALALADQPPGIDYLGAGYDLVFGNPDGSPAASSVTDPGFRVHVLKYNWDEEFNTCSGLESNWTCPREATILPGSSCLQQSSSSEISSTRSFQRALQSDCSVRGSVKGSYGGFSGSASFSASRAMSSMQDTIQKRKTTTFQSKAVCVEYIASLKMGLTSNLLETLPDFNAAVKELPLTYVSCFQMNSPGGPCPQRVDSAFGDLPPVKPTGRRLKAEADDDDDDDDDDTDNKCACDASVALYFRFIQLYGTHYTTRVEMGGKIVHRVEIKTSDVESLKSKQVDVTYGASMKASYKAGLGSVSASVATNGGNSAASKSYDAVMSVAQKEININIGGSPNEDWRQWASSTTTAPMPIRYQLSSLVDLVSKVDDRKAQLFALAVADYVAAYGKTLAVSTSTNSIVTGLQINYSLQVGKMTSATFRVMIGNKGDMIPALITVTNAVGSFNVPVPKQQQMSFGAFVGNVPITLEYVSGVFSPALMEAQKMSLEEQVHLVNMEADLSMKKRKKKGGPPAASSVSVTFSTIQPFAVMSDNSVVPLDDQYAGAQIAVAAPWSINPME